MRLRIRGWMELRSVSQAQIAAALGVSRATVSAWVEGRAKPGGGRLVVFPDHESLEALCLFFECTPSDILEIQKEKTDSGLTWRDFRNPRGGPSQADVSRLLSQYDEIAKRGES